MSYKTNIKDLEIFFDKEKQYEFKKKVSCHTQIATVLVGRMC